MEVGVVAKKITQSADNMIALTCCCTVIL